MNRLNRWSNLPLLLLFNLFLLVPVLGNAAPGDNAAAGANASASVPASNAEIRQWYNDQVATIGQLDQQWQKQGLTPEQRARNAYDIRHGARLKAREYMRDKSEVMQLQARDKEKYGNPDGPTFDYLVEQNRKKGLRGDNAYFEIIGSSERTNADVNKAYGAQKPDK